MSALSNGVGSDSSCETDLDSAGSEVVRCFICDDPCESSTPLTEMYTMRTSMGFPNKLAQLVGNGFKIIICNEDYVCLRCTNLVNWLDRLDDDVEQVKSSLIHLLNKKYAFNTDEDQTFPTVPPKSQKQSTGSGNSSMKGNTGRYFLRPRKVVGTNSDHSTTSHQSVAKVQKMCTSQRSFQCKQCSATFTQFVAMNQHMLRNHKPVMDNTSSDSHVSAVNTSSNNSENALLNGTKNTTSHATETVTESANGQRKPKDTKPLLKKRPAKPKPYECQTCFQRFETRAAITVHARKHQTKFVCRVCDMPFLKWNLLVKHIRIHQKPDRPADSAEVADNASDMASAKLWNTEVFSQSSPELDTRQEPMRTISDDNKMVESAPGGNKPLNDAAAEDWISEEVGDNDSCSTSSYTGTNGKSTVVPTKDSTTLPISLPNLNESKTIEQSTSAAHDQQEIPIPETDDEIKFIANESGYFLEYDNHILTNAGGDQIIVKDPDQIKELLHRIGLIQTGKVQNGNTPESTADMTGEMALPQGENNNTGTDDVPHFTREETFCTEDYQPIGEEKEDSVTTNGQDKTSEASGGTNST
ncbi:zinc finger protein 473 homolog [Drosophila willistoni]|uniref:zinc finger protein 473 homolog n=1 Tax=Drosophila willistoni TaxID=7260 RepID=UPI001F076ABA|nr:zinc finger protein 473 homolog [Drosophila willistoni]